MRYRANAGPLNALERLARIQFIDKRFYPTIERAALLQTTSNGLHATINLAAAYESQARTRRQAGQERSVEWAARASKAMRKIKAGIVDIADGADAIEVYARVTGSRPFD